jgi:hypothetical protein
MGLNVFNNNKNSVKFSFSVTTTVATSLIAINNVDLILLTSYKVVQVNMMAHLCKIYKVNKWTYYHCNSIYNTLIPPILLSHQLFPIHTPPKTLNYYYHKMGVFPILSQLFLGSCKLRYLPTIMRGTSSLLSLVPGGCTSFGLPFCLPRDGWF